MDVFIAYIIDFVQFNIRQSEDKCRNKSYAKSEMRRHLVLKLGIFGCLRYGYNKSLFLVLSPKRLDILTQIHLVCFNMT